MSDFDDDDEVSNVEWTIKEGLDDNEDDCFGVVNHDRSDDLSSNPYARDSQSIVRAFRERGDAEAYRASGGKYVGKSEIRSLRGRGLI